jgi:hypothetical protein
VHVGPVPKLFLLGLRSKERCPNQAVILPPCHVKDPIFRFLLAEHAARWSSAVTAFFDLCLCPPAVLPCRFLGPRSAPAIFRSCRRFLFAQHYFSVRIFLLRQGFVLVTVFFFTLEFRSARPGISVSRTDFWLPVNSRSFSSRAWVWSGQLQSSVPTAMC